MNIDLHLHSPCKEQVHRRAKKPFCILGAHTHVASLNNFFQPNNSSEWASVLTLFARARAARQWRCRAKMHNSSETKRRFSVSGCLVSGKSGTHLWGFGRGWGRRVAKIRASQESLWSASLPKWKVDCRRAAREKERSLTAERQMNGELCCVYVPCCDMYASGGFGTQRLFGCGGGRRELAAAPAEYQSSLPSAALPSFLAFPPSVGVTDEDLSLARSNRARPRALLLKH